MPSLELSDVENLWAYQATIPNGASASEGFNTQGRAIVGLVMPAGWTAADLAYSSSLDGATFQQVYDNGGNPEKTKVAASQNIAIPQSDALFFPNVKLLSVSTADDTTPVNQGAARVITVLLKRFLGGS